MANARIPADAGHWTQELGKRSGHGARRMDAAAGPPGRRPMGRPQARTQMRCRKAECSDELFSH